MFSANASQVLNDIIYAEDVFAVAAYTGNGSAMSLTNKPNLLDKGGLIVIKRTDWADPPCFFDSERGTSVLFSSDAQAESSLGTGTVTRTTDGISLGNNTAVNGSGYNYVAWMFRKAPKFLSIVTYTGDNSSERLINHTLGVTPGLILIKSRSTSGNWQVAVKNSSGTFYRTNAAGNGYLNANGPLTGTYDFEGLGYITPTVFCPQVVADGSISDANASGVNYIAYLFADDNSTTGVIRSGSFTTDGSGRASVQLSWETQFLIVKRVNASEDWFVVDTARNWDQGGLDYRLRLNSTSAETSGATGSPLSDGFKVSGLSASTTYVFLAIRRPNKPALSATSLLDVTVDTYSNPVSTTDGGARSYVSKIDMAMHCHRDGSSNTLCIADKIRGFGTTSAMAPAIFTHSTGAESTALSAISKYRFNGYEEIVYSSFVTATNKRVGYVFTRAPGFFDIACYTGVSSGTVTVPHNLGVPPELVLIKCVNQGGTGFDWVVCDETGSAQNLGNLNTDAAFIYASTLLTTSASNVVVNANDTRYNFTYDYVMYLFASLPGVSKVGTYTGDGSPSGQNINCGFSAGARFVLVKRTDAVGDWRLYDSARGITTNSNDPWFALNSAGAETAVAPDGMEPFTGGFQVWSGLNTSNATYFYLAIA